jgi:Second Messenger Oligonucleotide or Dinucleotide Synthetase domain
MAASFERFKANLEITTLQQSVVSTRQRSVRTAVARRLAVADSFVTGSYRRHTMIAPLSQADVDVFVVLDPIYYESDGHARLLDRVRRVLLETYPSTPRVSRNGQAVTITFTDFVVDVVPGFYRTGGGYLIPSSTEGRWIPTNPKVHESFVTRANAAHAGDLVPLIKMIKRWNRQINGAFRAFYLELLTEKVLRGITISDYASGCRYVFDKGREAVRYTIADPVGFGNTVAGLASVTAVSEAVGRFDTALGRAQRAEALAQLGRTAEAVGEWRKVFGNYFPAYG